MSWFKLSDVLNGIVACFVFAAIAVAFGVLRTVIQRIPYVVRALALTEYEVFVQLEGRHSIIIMMFLRRIAFMLALFFPWLAFVPLYYLSTGRNVAATIGMAAVSGMVAACIALFLTRLPTALYYAVRYPDAYRKTMRKRLGRLPDDPPE